MQRSVGERSDRDRLVSRLADEPCAYCATGTLSRATFDADDAVVCDSCETPAVRFW